MTQDEINRQLLSQNMILLRMIEALADRVSSLERPLGNNTTTRGKDNKVLPFSIHARIIAQELRDK